MTWNFDKYTSWRVPCINVIFDLEPYINILQDELDTYTKELWTWSYNWPFAIKQIRYEWILLLTYALIRVIVLEVTIYVYGSK